MFSPLRCFEEDLSEEDLFDELARTAMEQAQEQGLDVLELSESCETN